MTDILSKVLRGGWKTSEFWLSVLAIVAPQVLGRTDTVVAQGTTALSQHGTLGALAAGAVAGAYAIGRSIVKAKTAGALLAPVPPPPMPLTPSSGPVPPRT